MGRSKILLAGESWVTTATHIKGFDQFPTVTFHRGADALAEALADSDFALTYMSAHEAQTHFPSTLAGLQEYDAVILSDIGANTLLLHPDTWIESKPTPNRLKLIRDYVGEGRGLMMVGGYYSFQGINAGRPLPGNAGRRRAARNDPSLGRSRRSAGGIPGGGPGACRPSDPRGPRRGVAAAAGLQRGRAEGGGGASAQGPGRRGRASPAGDGRLWQGPAPSPGPRTSARTGALPTSSRGRATAACGGSACRG